MDWLMRLFDPGVAGQKKCGPSSVSIYSANKISSPRNLIFQPPNLFLNQAVKNNVGIGNYCSIWQKGGPFHNRKLASCEIHKIVWALKKQQWESQTKCSSLVNLGTHLQIAKSPQVRSLETTPTETGFVCLFVPFAFVRSFGCLFVADFTCHSSNQLRLDENSSS